jgi:FAD-linked oxidoreductase
MDHGRRNLLKLATAASALAATGTIPAVVRSAFADEAPAAKPASKALPWHNWSGGQSCEPAKRAAPANEGELAELLKSAPAPIRAVGAGHSFSGLVPTDGTLLTLDRFSGVIDHDPATHQATVRAGTRLAAMAEELAKRGLALANMPDVNKQSIAGAISTGTHGTGAEIGSLSSFVTGLTLVTPKGDVIDCDAKTRPEIFDAARVSVGALGIVTKVRLQADPVYKLKRRTWVAPVEEMLDAVPELAAKNRNFEFYYIPFSGMALGITNNITDEPETPTPINEDDDGLRELKMIEDWLGWSPSLRRWIIQKVLSGMKPQERVDYSHKTLSTERGVRFNEMEYHLPREAGPAALREIIETIEKNNIKVFFPIEFRTTAPDTIWLSPFYGRKSCSIAVHQFYEWDYKPYFAAIEPIHRKHEGRPHWGKLNTLTAAEFSTLYPKWKDFLAVRAELDPEARLLNPYLKSVFGVA